MRQLQRRPKAISDVLLNGKPVLICVGVGGRRRRLTPRDRSETSHSLCLSF